MTLGISGIIFAKNEEALIAQAVESLKRLSDEVIVADMASKDATAEIARRHGARVIEVPDFGYVEPARPLAEAECRYEWIANIDADEVLPQPLVTTLRGIIEADDVDAIRTSRLNFMLGSPVRWAGWGPASDRLIRFYRKGALQHASGIHQPPAIRSTSKVFELPNDDDDECIWHFNYRGWDHFLEKLNRYTTVEATEQVEAGATIPTPLEVGKSLARSFKQRFWHQRGYRDGYRGVTLAALMVAYNLMVYAKTRQLLELGDSDAIAARYLKIAEDIDASREPAPL